MLKKLSKCNNIYIVFILKINIANNQLMAWGNIPH